MISAYTQYVIEVFSEQHDPVAAAPMAKYMKGKFDYFGIKSPLRKEISKPFLVKNNLPPLDDVPNIMQELWNQPERELQYFALELLQRYEKISPMNWIDLYEGLITQKSWWDTVDGLAASQVGSHFNKVPEQIPSYTQKWMKSENMWLQRTCLIFQLKYRDQTDFDLMKSFIIPLADSKEFFIRKAIGWALRQYSRTDAPAVVDFVAKQPLSNLSSREALRLLK
ncbi:MAG: DNA alkylation repair protein [Cyclobacteriaceae bacterium]|nr:DNA alkylation repair protein [Cyclobacteriaceae bacterium]